MANVMPPLTAEQYAALKADIEKRGVLVPVEIDAASGEVVDGHHRIKACGELGIEVPTIKRAYSSDSERIEQALILNMLRRHLGPIGWAKAFRLLAKTRGVRLGQGSRNDSTSAKVAEVASELGVPSRTARRRLELEEELRSEPDLSAQVDAGEMEAKRAQRVKRERDAERRKQEPAAPLVLPANCTIHHCRLSELPVADSSVDLIFTDPPYPAKYLPDWTDLAALASRALKPGGMLIAYTGQYHLPIVLRALQERLEYLWLGALVTPGAHNQVQQRHIRSAAKPLLFFARPPYKPGAWYEDAWISEQRDKADHRWQQSLGAARYYIETLTEPGALVVDPFLGSGTTAVACRDLNRSFIGCDIDPVAVETAQKRLAA